MVDTNTLRISVLSDLLFQAEVLLERFEFNSDGGFRLHPSEREVNSMLNSVQQLRGVLPFGQLKPSTSFEDLIEARPFLADFCGLTGGRMLRSFGTPMWVFPEAFSDEVATFDAQVRGEARLLFRDHREVFTWSRGNLILEAIHAPSHHLECEGNKPFRLAAWVRTPPVPSSPHKET